ncbi:MAG: hypothetical protein SGJ18_15555 [Pseudomonadota bacterium]|nr:hypothetical protein [Pseudomonadota bacterium]
MMTALVFLHASIGEVAALAFLWVSIELFEPTATRIKRATAVSLVGVIATFLCWILGGAYYVIHYVDFVRPVIKSGPYPWAQEIMMEIKQHIFLLIPFLALMVYLLIRQSSREIILDKTMRRRTIVLSLVTFFLCFLMTALGYLTSFGARRALEGLL